MGKDQKYNSIVSRPIGGLDTDSDASNQADGTNTFALNAVEETTDGQHFSKSNELGNTVCTQKPIGYEIIGDKYIEDDKSVVILVNTEDTGEQIGLLDKASNYTTLVSTKVLGLSIMHQCMIVYRLRRGKERVIYWVDGNAKPRTYNLDRPYNFYSTAYQSYIKAGNNPDTYIGEKWDASAFDLIKTANKIPFFSDIEIREVGSILPGSLNFAIQLVDDDLNPTGWLTTSNTVNIFNDSLTNPYQRIRGSRNINSTSQSFSRTNKSVKLTITNLDTSFPYYRVAIIRAAGTNGEPDKVLVSELFPTSDSNFIYSGNDASLKETSLNDILIDTDAIFAPKYIEQIENKLTLENTKGPQVNFCEFQKFASKIKTDIAYKEVFLNNVLSEPNIKNAKARFEYTGYMPGEVVSMGIVYVAKDWQSPVCHIPGRSASTVSSMLLYEGDSRYLDIHNCSTDNYWGKDYDGGSLVGKKQRHHRFPFRKNVSKPLFTTTSGITTINKYKLTATITLNPTWTPGPIAYPQVGSPLAPAVIPYIFQYQIDGNPTINGYSGVLVDSDIGTQIEIYDDVTELDNSVILAYGQLDITSSLYTYQTLANERFIITYSYSSYTASSSINTDVSEIFGFEFSNIEKPHPDVIGFYIVRNERTDDDRLILDTAVFGAMTEFEQYKAAGQLMPKQYYTVNSCGKVDNAGKTLAFYQKGVWFHNAEYQFLNKQQEFNRIETEGFYERASVNLPTISNVAGTSCNNGNGDNGGTKGVYINDVQAGTSYDPAINKSKNKDDDGFDLVLGYRNNNMTYSSDNVFQMPSKKRVLYLNATANQNIDGDTIYNTSVDNKRGFYLTNDNIAAYPFETKLMYGALVRDNPNAYANFISRPYYKEHNNLVLFSTNTVNNFEVFNGDAQISATTLVSSVFYDIVVSDRPKKSKVWKIVVGSLLVIAAVVATVVTAGAATPLAVSLISLAISYGVSLAASGIKFEQFKSMVDVDYEKGLKETVIDGDLYATVRDIVGRGDDTIRWFCDRVSNIYMESSVPVGLRSGLTNGTTDFIDAPAAYDEVGFRTYLTEKFTVIDRDQGSGRLYKGYAGAEIYDINLDYMRFNKQKIYTHLPIEYDCCSDNKEVFPLRVHWSQTSFQEEKIDNYRAFLPNNYRDMEGEHGEITGIYKLGSSLFIQTREAVWHLPQNNQERVTGEIISFIGTGEFFNILPRKILDDSLGSGGTQHNWATVKTPQGVVYLSGIEHKVYLHGDKLKDISATKRRSWFQENMKSFLVEQMYNLLGIEYPYDNNPANPNGVGYISAYDKRFNRVIITKRDYRLLPEHEGSLKLVATRPVIILDDRIVYAVNDGKFYNKDGHLSLLNQSFFEEKSFTISFSFHTNQWVSLHSYIPNYYVYTQNNLYSSWVGDENIYRHNKIGLYQTFKGQRYPFIIEYVAKVNPLMQGIIEDISLYTVARVWVEALNRFREEKLITFNKIELSNSYQCSGTLELEVKQTKSNPSEWYKQQTKNYGNKIPITRSEGKWSINQLRDYVVTNNIALFSEEWADIKDDFPIDRVINLPAISYSKSWTELQGFKDKYIVIRLIFDTFDNINLIMNYSVTNEENSIK